MTFIGLSVYGLNQESRADIGINAEISENVITLGQTSIEVDGLVEKLLKQNRGDHEIKLNSYGPDGHFFAHIFFSVTLYDIEVCDGKLEPVSTSNSNVQIANTYFASSDVSEISKCKGELQKVKSENLRLEEKIASMKEELSCSSASNSREIQSLSKMITELNERSNKITNSKDEELQASQELVIAQG